MEISPENQILQTSEGGLLGWLLSLAGHSVLTAVVSAACPVWGRCDLAGGSLRSSVGVVGQLELHRV